MISLRDYLAGALGGAFNILCWGTLILGGILILVAIGNIVGERKNIQGFLFSLLIGLGLIFLFLWIANPFELFSGSSFSK